jgi:hypothetical protein
MIEGWYHSHGYPYAKVKSFEFGDKEATMSHSSREDHMACFVM